MHHKIRLTGISAIVFLVFSLSVYSQEVGHDHDHDHHKYELGVANSLVYFTKEKEVAYGLHLHFVRKIDHSDFGYGIAFEKIFDEHRHNFIGIVGSYSPFDRLHVNLTPGLAFEGNELSALKFAFHAESSYDFNFGNFHLGPLLELAYDPEDYHIGLGLHIGYGF